MVENSIPSFVLSRETGSLQTHKISPGTPSAFLAQPRPVPLAPRMLMDTKSSSETIWLGSKENILIMHNSKGRVFTFDLISNKPFAPVLPASDKVVKLFFIRNSLFLVTKPNHSDYLAFYTVPLYSLQNNSWQKDQILVDLKVKLRDLKEFCLKTYRIVVETGESIEVWDILTQTKVETYQLVPSVKYQYTNDCIVFWKLEDEKIKLNVIRTKVVRNLEFSFGTNKNIYFCHLCNDELVLGFENSALVALNLDSGICRILSSNMPKTVFCFEESQNFLAVFRNGTGINAVEEKTLGFEAFENCLACEMENHLFVYGENGKVGALTDGKIVMIGEGVRDVEQIGGNAETGQMFFACEGKVYVLE